MIAHAHALAHLSDPHLSSLEGVAWSQLMSKRALGYWSWRRRRRYVHKREALDRVVADLLATAPDLVLISGDLTHIGLPAECETAARWLDGLPRPICLVPGNHDRYVADDPSTTTERWARYLGGAGRPWPRVTRLPGLAIVALDSAVPSAPLLATGTLGAAQRDELACVLATTGAEGRFRVVMLHHSPLPNGHAWRKRLTDARALMTLLDEHGAELVIHGHGHVERIDRVSTRRGEMIVVAAPSASDARDGRGGWNRYRIEGEVGGWTVELTARRLHGDAVVTASEQRFEVLRA